MTAQAGWISAVARLRVTDAGGRRHIENTERKEKKALSPISK